MPPLGRPETEHKIPFSSEALLAARTDVLVVGAGPAGIGAALGAARAGANVVLAERYGYLGGSATVALVMPLMSAHTQEGRFRQSGRTTLYPTDHGEGRRVIAGVLMEIVERLIECGGAVPPSLETGMWFPLILKSSKSPLCRCLMKQG
jgi:NADPH-dependent 2,4-dienoyl-CoA reductase/sulfur reductase-like enzyme